ncbi:MAG: uracil-DNA glycosylase family protein [Saprospiraceae bacterium]
MDTVQQAKSCTHCAQHLPHGPRPVFTVHPRARVLIIGQAPGRKVHESGIPWDDASGHRLRAWLGVDAATFYNPECFALLPMGFCYPGAGKSGDLPPRPECAPLWHRPLLNMMPGIKLTLLFGQYAQEHYLGAAQKNSLTETVRNWRAYVPAYLPLPHPSPRNQIWTRKNPWFETEILPYLQAQVALALAGLR